MFRKKEKRVCLFFYSIRCSSARLCRSVNKSKLGDSSVSNIYFWEFHFYFMSFENYDIRSFIRFRYFNRCFCCNKNKLWKINLNIFSSDFLIIFLNNVHILLISIFHFYTRCFIVHLCIFWDPLQSHISHARHGHVVILIFNCCNLCFFLILFLAYRRINLI